MDDRFEERNEELLEREVDRDTEKFEQQLDRMDDIRERQEERNETLSNEMRSLDRENISKEGFDNKLNIEISVREGMELPREDLGRPVSLKLVTEERKDGKFEHKIDEKSLASVKLYDGNKLSDYIDQRTSFTTNERIEGDKLDVKLAVFDEKGEAFYRSPIERKEPEIIDPKDRFDTKELERIETKLSEKGEITFREAELRDEYRRISEERPELKLPEINPIERAPIDRELERMEISKGALEVMDVLRDAGYKADLVGGCVRDGALGRPAKDEDITTNLQPDRVIDLFERENYRVVPTGLEHGTVTVMVPDRDNDNKLVGYEITTYRIDGESRDQRHPDSVTFVDDIRKDMERRDLTINAMAYNPREGLTDYFGGMKDLRDKTIQTVGNADDRFKEDALRMMRAVRFSAQLDFKIADNVRDAISDRHEDIRNVSKERVHDELCKILKSDNPAEGLRNLHELQLMKEVAPTLDRCFDERDGRQDNPYHSYTIGEHTLRVVENCPNDLVTRMAALGHDLGKFETRTTDERGTDHFIGHPERSKELLSELMTDLKFTTRERTEAVRLVELHESRLEPNREDINRFIIKNPDITPETFDRLIDLQKADIYGQNPDMIGDRVERLEEVRSLYHEITSGPYRESDLAINGRDIMDIRENSKGEPIEFRGQEIKEAKHELLAYVLKDQSRNNYTELRNYLLENSKQIKNNALERSTEIKDSERKSLKETASERSELTKCERNLAHLDREKVQEAYDKYRETGERDKILTQWESLNQRYDELTSVLYEKGRLNEEEMREYLERTNDQRDEDKFSSTTFSSKDSSPFQAIKEGKR